MNNQLSFWILIIGFAIVVYYALVKPLINRLFYNNKTIVGLKAQDPAFIMEHTFKHPLIILGALFDLVVIIFAIPLPDSIISSIVFWLSFACLVYLFVMPFLYAETIPKEAEA